MYIVWTCHRSRTDSGPNLRRRSTPCLKLRNGDRRQSCTTNTTKRPKMKITEVFRVRLLSQVDRFFASTFLRPPQQKRSTARARCSPVGGTPHPPRPAFAAPPVSWGATTRTPQTPTHRPSEKRAPAHAPRPSETHLGLRTALYGRVSSRSSRPTPAQRYSPHITHMRSHAAVERNCHNSQRTRAAELAHSNQHASRTKSPRERTRAFAFSRLLTDHAPSPR